eukprot:TRINITY_DN10992_c0_g1_i2.p2 TRINITY_DN10992_c0_g1~~TRINITY_DN10992_c0_g1_i2.p2  ORF type:complete len:172 (+),score=19.26 TRINITY_DN10992_c0_g1_i2:256-771(+)
MSIFRTCCCLCGQHRRIASKIARDQRSVRSSSRFDRLRPREHLQQFGNIDRLGQYAIKAVLDGGKDRGHIALVGEQQAAQVGRFSTQAREAVEAVGIGQTVGDEDSSIVIATRATVRLDRRASVVKPIANAGERSTDPLNAVRIGIDDEESTRLHLPHSEVAKRFGLMRLK